MVEPKQGIGTSIAAGLVSTVILSRIMKPGSAALCGAFIGAAMFGMSVGVERNDAAAKAPIDSGAPGKTT